MELCNKVSGEKNKLNVVNKLKLSLNVSKTNFMVFSRSLRNMPCKVYINEVEIERVYVSKFLGVCLDAELSWKNQVVNVKIKLFRNLAVMKKSETLIE